MTVAYLPSWSNRRDVEFGAESPLNFGWVGALQKQLQRLDQVAACVLDAVALAGDVEFRAKRDKPAPLPLDQARQLVNLFHKAATAPIV